MWFCCSGSWNALVWDARGELKFPEVGISLWCHLPSANLRSQEQAFCSSPKPPRTLSFLWHWPMKDLEGKSGTSRAKIALYFPKFALFLETSNLWPVLLHSWLSLFLVLSALCISMILFLRNGYQNALGFNDADTQSLLWKGKMAQEQDRAQSFVGVNSQSCHLWLVFCRQIPSQCELGLLESGIRIIEL